MVSKDGGKVRKSEEALLRELLALLDDEFDALTKMDYRALYDVAVHKEYILASIEARQGRSEVDVKRLSGTSEERFRKLLGEVKEKNDINYRILERTLEHVTRTASLLETCLAPNRYLPDGTRKRLPRPGKLNRGA